jgi:hypothetical protein
MRLIFIYGLPGTGKLTVARELADSTGFKLFHNHMVVDLLLSVFQFGTPPFIALREEIWLSVFDRACRAGLPGLIFTFAPEKSVRPAFVGETQRTVTSAGGVVDFVELTCPLAELERRLDSPSRRKYGKLTSVSLLKQLYARGIFAAPSMPSPSVAIDTGICTPAGAAAQIAEQLGLPLRTPDPTS